MKKLVGVSSLRMPDVQSGGCSPLRLSEMPRLDGQSFRARSKIVGRCAVLRMRQYETSHHRGKPCPENA